VGKLKLAPLTPQKEQEKRRHYNGISRKCNDNVVHSL
jgi:hypothetical protein